MKYSFWFQVQEYKDELISKAEILITRGFPEKIVELNELLSTKMFADRNFHDVFQVKIVFMVITFTYTNFW